MLGGLQQGQAQLTGYGSTGQAGLNAPKEIGLLQRVEGVRGGLAEILERAANLECRISGTGPVPAGNPAPIPNGLASSLADAENSIRAIMQALGRLNEAF